jgi:hypothetical protein
VPQERCPPAVLSGTVDSGLAEAIHVVIVLKLLRHLRSCVLMPISIGFYLAGRS